MLITLQFAAAAARPRKLAASSRKPLPTSLLPAPFLLPLLDILFIWTTLLLIGCLTPILAWKKKKKSEVSIFAWVALLRELPSKGKRRPNNKCNQCEKWRADKEIIPALMAAAAAGRADGVQRAEEPIIAFRLFSPSGNEPPPPKHSPNTNASTPAGVKLSRLRPPVILKEGRAVSDGSQVGVGLSDIGQRGQLADDVVDHQSHEAQGLEVVGPCGEDLVQPLQVLPQATLNVPQRAGDLSGEQQNGCHAPNEVK